MRQLFFTIGMFAGALAVALPAAGASKLNVLLIIADDLRRLFIWTKAKVTADKETTKDGITRKKFLQMGALGTFGVFASTFFYGMLRGGYNYTIHYVDLKLNNLPKNFEYALRGRSRVNSTSACAVTLSA